jgi:small neutral amino acid transporter SnatA (MarC family)
MSSGLLLLAFVGAVNPCRIRPGLPARPGVVTLGAVVALAVGAALAAAGGTILDVLDVSPESFRLAAGLVLTVEGARALVFPRLAIEPELSGLGAALVPVAFPYVLQPGVIVLAVAAGGDDLAAPAIGALALALVLVVVAGTVPHSIRREGLFLAGARLLGALEIAAGVALAVDAIHDV